MFNEWTLELKAMADRIISMRQQLFDALKSRGTNFWLFLSPLYLQYVYSNLAVPFLIDISFMILYCNLVVGIISFYPGLTRLLIWQLRSYC